MLTYLPDELRSFAVNRPPARAVRKRLFSLHLWRPARRRRPCVTTTTNNGADHNPVASTNQSADRGLLLGWLNVQSLRNKTVTVDKTITEQSLDVVSLTETWHTDSTDASLRLATPEGYAVVDVRRRSGRQGGGVAIIYRKHLPCSILPMPSCSTMEIIAVKLTTSDGPVIIVNIYRPGSDRPTALFFEELAAVLETFVLNPCPVVVGGDLNVHVQDDTDVYGRRFNDLIASFDMTQHVRGPTHRAGHTLDLVLTFSALRLQSVSVEPAGAISDHALVTCRLPVVDHSSTVIERIVRG